MRKILQVHRLDLKCDHCRNVIKGVEFDACLIGLCCVFCGNDMLTQADYAAAARLFATLEKLNKWLGWLFGARELTAQNSKPVCINPHEDSLLIYRPRQHYDFHDARY